MLKSGGANGGGAILVVMFLTLAFVTAIRGTFAYRKVAASLNRVPISPTAQ
jgi:hypothetical protein